MSESGLRILFELWSQSQKLWSLHGQVQKNTEVKDLLHVRTYVVGCNRSRSVSCYSFIHINPHVSLPSEVEEEVLCAVPSCTCSRYTYVRTYTQVNTHTLAHAPSEVEVVPSIVSEHPVHMPCSNDTYDVHHGHLVHLAGRHHQEEEVTHQHSSKQRAHTPVARNESKRGRKVWGCTRMFHKV